MKLSSDQQKSFNDKSTSKLNKPVAYKPAGAATSSNLPSDFLISTPLPFGNYNGGLFTFPNDGVQLDIFNDQDFYYESITAATEYTIEGTDVIIDLEKELVKAGYESGDFRVRTRLLRNYLGSASTLKLLVQEISADRLELRVIPAQLAGDGTAEGTESADAANADLFRFFGEGFFNLDKQAVLSSLYVFLDNTTSIEVTDYIQDKYTVQSYPYSIIFKLQQALPLSVGIATTVWVSQETNPPVVENVVVYPTQKVNQFTKIKGPNFDVLRKKTLSTDTEYQSWDEILSSNARQLTQTVFSQSLVEGIQLNVDYTRFENFAKFGSVFERIKNFEYKVRLIENYQGVSASLAGSTASESFYVQTQLTTTLNKIDNIVGAFDGFEKYMYFESSSYVSNSFGESLDMAWPKSTSIKPYTLYGSNTTQVENWLSGILESASLYDNNNSYSLRRLVPEHIQQQDSQVVDSFISMLGHFFDVQYEYINQIPKVYDRQESLTEGFAKELVYHVAQGLGVDFSNGDNFQDLWSYTLGLDASGSYDNTLKLSGEDRTRETWKRIINNLPYLLKTKGTERGIRALINCYGIPSTILRIKEYGGPEVDLDRQSTYDHDRFYYALNIGSGSSQLSINWRDASSGRPETAKVPQSFEFRFRVDTKYSSGQVGSMRLAHLATTATSPYVHINTGRDTIGDFVELYLSGSTSSSRAYLPSSTANTNLFDGNWVNVLVDRSGYTNNTNQSTSSYGLFIGQKANYSETPIIASASILLQSSDVADPSNWLTNATALQFGTGSILNGAVTASFSGSLQEVRLWGNANISQSTVFASPPTPTLLCVTGGLNLEQSPFYAHVISPTTIVGANYEDQSWTGATSSFADLVFRLPLGTDNKKINLNATSSLSGSQPNYNYATRSGSFFNYTSNTASYWIPVVETNYMPWPDISGNRAISNKVRLEQTINPSRELYRNKKTQLSLQDDQPVDSPRLGVYLSPVDEINKDIAEQFAGLSLDDYIGDYNEVYSNAYEQLAHIRQEYLKKNVIPHKTQNYVRLLQHFNGSLFSMIKQMVPYRANLQTGLVLEPHLLDRSKVKTVNRPVAEDEYLETLIDMPSVGEPTGTVSNITGSIESSEIDPIGVYYFIPSGSVGTNMVNISALQNEYNRIQVPAQGRRSARLNSTSSYEDVIFSKFSLEDTVELNVTSYGRDKIEGSQYEFFSWYKTGSIPYTGITTNVAGFAYLNSVGDDYSDPLALDATKSRPSEVFNPTEVPYNVYDFFNRTGSFDKDPADTTYTGSYFNTALGKFGFRFTTQVTGSSSATRWFQNSQTSGPLRFTTLANSTVTSSLTVPVFFFKDYPNAMYEISFDVKYLAQPGAPTNPTFYFKFGSTSSSYTQDVTLTPTQTSYTIITKADGPYLAIMLNTSQSSTSAATMDLDNLRVVPYIKTAVQDYQVGPLASIGQRNQKYDGCKLTAVDVNVDSPDTIDGGPVIEVITGPGANISVSPSNNQTPVQRGGGGITISNPGTTPRNTPLQR
ncbi:hypothetical protein UFOVP450_155 [uncultured Caudovirales phage]|uniref:Uncharacterized protein n=1 Tax=uncultured Caudovirales phage TaxID=2100421 RepID=A0A6J5MEP1_9CAUD|nr:hypothetical protein UFOVP450_155 [uncultured Caudovirales phage]